MANKYEIAHPNSMEMLIYEPDGQVSPDISYVKLFTHAEVVRAVKELKRRIMEKHTRPLAVTDNFLKELGDQQ